MSTYAYHGTTLKKLKRIRNNGLVPGAYSSYGDKYSIYDDGKHIFYSDDPNYIRGSYGDIIIRFPWPIDSTFDENVYGRTMFHQLVSKKKVSVKDIEVEFNGTWVSLDSIEIK